MYNLFKCNKQITCTFPNQRHFPYSFTFFYRNTLKLAPFKNNENHQETSLQQNRSLVSKEKGIKILTRRIKSSSLISTQRFTVTRSWTRIDRTETQRERRGELTGTISAHRSVPMPRQSEETRHHFHVIANTRSGRGANSNEPKRPRHGYRGAKMHGTGMITMLPAR